MGRRPSNSCELSDLFRVLGEAYVLNILHHLISHGRPARFKEIQVALGISSNTLTESLKRMTASGLLDRKAYAEIPPRVEYAPTPKALELAPIFENLEAWSSRNSLEPEATT